MKEHKVIRLYDKNGNHIFSLHNICPHDDKGSDLCDTDGNMVHCCDFAYVLEKYAHLLEEPRKIIESHEITRPEVQ